MFYEAVIADPQSSLGYKAISSIKLQSQKERGEVLLPPEDPSPGQQVALATGVASQAKVDQRPPIADGRL